MGVVQIPATQSYHYEPQKLPTQEQLHQLDSDTTQVLSTYELPGSSPR